MKNKDDNLKNDSIRTFDTDSKKAIKEKGVKGSASLLRQAKNKEKNEKPDNTKNSIFFGLAGLLIIISLIFITISISSPGQAPISQDLIYADQQETIDLSNFNRNNISEKINKKIEESPNNPLTIFLPTKEENERILSLSTESFFQGLQIEASDELKNQLQEDFLIGLAENKEVFLLFNLDDFSEGHRAVSNWENGMLSDLSIVLYSEDRSDLSDALNQNFQDKMVENRLVRTLKDQEGNTVLTYLFVDEKTIIITTSQKAAIDIISRLKTGANL